MMSFNRIFESKSKAPNYKNVSKYVCALILSQSVALSAAANSTSATTRPNIVVITIDDMRPATGAYGHPEVITPNLDDLASRGTLFENAYANSPLCAPSRAGLMTGTWVNQLDLRDLSARIKSETGIKPGNLMEEWMREKGTLVNRLHAAGYWTATHGKFYHGNPPSFEPFDVPGKRWLTRNHDKEPIIQQSIVDQGGTPTGIINFQHNKGKSGGHLYWASVKGAENKFSDYIVASKTVQQIKKRPKDKPFFIAAGFSRPHLPFVAPKKFFDLYPKRNSNRFYTPPPGFAGDLPNFVTLADPYNIKPRRSRLLYNGGMTDSQVEELVRGYYASVSFVDAQVGRIISALDKEGLMENTIVIVLGDHGYHLSEHGLFEKRTPFSIANRIPLIVAGYGTKENQRRAEFIEIADIYPTVLNFAKLRPSSDIEGKSFKRVLFGNCDEVCQNQKDFKIAFSSIGSTYSGFTSKWRVTLTADSDRKTTLREVYDLISDPNEHRNLVISEGFNAEIQTILKSIQKKYRLLP